MTKRYSKKLLFVLCIIAGFSSRSPAQGFLKTQGTAIVNELGDTVLLKGMGLGGWMLQEGYMLQTAGFANAQHQLRQRIEDLIGEAETDIFYEAWLDNHVRKSDIDSLKSWGFNSVRLPMHYNLFTLPIEDEPIPGQHTWLLRGFELTDSLLSWCKANQMYVILDLHAAPGGQGRDQGISDYDTNKPSLWESKANRDKTVALWKRLATHYADETWIGGYDLINEPNWPLDGNIPLRDLYHEITAAIREVDNNHILFIEGNWFANDFTALTPPWDNNMVYSPHKYWSINDQSSIQWVLDIRTQHDVPIYFGETGENSNTWFRDAIRLFDDFDLGWAWWPMKKIESIAGPLSVVKPSGYQDLLDYWNGDGPKPSVVDATNGLMQLTENLKVENCIYQKDVIDAMFYQVVSDNPRAFKKHVIPGIIHATDFDLGPVDAAYFDSEVANYQVSTGNFTAWNNGWVYRNDGVDIEASEDNLNSNGYHVGWIDADEWIQYSVDILREGVYDVLVRTASNESGGSFHFATAGADLSKSVGVPISGGWQNWQSVIVPDIILTEVDSAIRFYADKPGFNVGSFQFIFKGETTTLPTEFVSAYTIDNKTINITINKPLDEMDPNVSFFDISVNGVSATILDATVDDAESRTLILRVSDDIKSSDVVTVSYDGTSVDAFDGTALQVFASRPVKNTLAQAYAVPGRIEAENYFFQSGIQLENTTDIGGGQNIGYLDAGDYLDYSINVAQTGTFYLDVRTASLSETGEIEVQLVADNGELTTLGVFNFAPTGGWQDWRTTTFTLALPAGNHQLRILITQPLFNINWIEFTVLTATEEAISDSKFDLRPNPGSGDFYVEGKLSQRQEIQIDIHNIYGQRVHSRTLQNIKELNEHLELSHLVDGLYIVSIWSKGRRLYRGSLIHQGR